jgi:hypothetical protein
MFALYSRSSVAGKVGVSAHGCNGGCGGVWSPQGTPEALPYPMRRRLSSTSESRAAPCTASRRGHGVAAGGGC